MSVKFLLFVLCALSGQYHVATISEHPIILIISYDGFRYDLIDSKNVNPVLKKLRDEGCYADYMDNVFITKTYPNHQSIATGLYPEVHGIVGNTFFDPKYGKALGVGDARFWQFSDDILPIWIANEKKGGGRYSGVMMWPGGIFNYSGMYPTYKKEWTRSRNWKSEVNEAIEWMTDPAKPANLVLLYYDQPDTSGHSFGPDSRSYLHTLQEIDKDTQFLLDRLNETGLMNHVNLFFLADHGVERFTMKDVIDLRKIVPRSKYDRYESSPTYMIFPKEGEDEFVYTALKNASDQGYPFRVYKKEDLLERWHYKNNRRVPPILALADPPHVFHDVINTAEYYTGKNASDIDLFLSFGVHGYDNEHMNMKPFFIATGPLLKKKFKNEPFENVDLFSLWANMLGFPEMAAGTNGSYDRVSGMLAQKNEASDIGNICGALTGIFLTGLSVAIALFFIHNRLRSRNKFFNQRPGEESSESRQRLLDSVETEEEA